MTRSRRMPDVVHLAYKNLHRAVRDGRWKLIEYLVEGRRTTQLFDIAEDPWETKNLASEPALAGRVRQMRLRLLEWRDNLGGDRMNELWADVERAL